EKMTRGTTVHAKFTLQGKRRKLPPEWETNLLRIGQEVLTNVLRHARASEFKVLLVFDSREIRLELRDNGCGFDPQRKHEGFGLQPINNPERARPGHGDFDCPSRRERCRTGRAMKRSSKPRNPASASALSPSGEQDSSLPHKCGV